LQRPIGDGRLVIRSDGHRENETAWTRARAPLLSEYRMFDVASDAASWRGTPWAAVEAGRAGRRVGLAPCACRIRAFSRGEASKEQAAAVMRQRNCELAGPHDDGTRALLHDTPAHDSLLTASFRRHSGPQSGHWLENEWKLFVSWHRLALPGGSGSRSVHADAEVLSSNAESSGEQRESSSMHYATHP